MTRYERAQIRMMMDELGTIKNDEGKIEYIGNEYATNLIERIDQLLTRLYDEARPSK